MSSRDPSHPPAFRAVAAAALMVVGLAVAGCQVRPLYAEATPGAGSPVAAELGRIAVATQRDRLAQELMNQLIFAFRGGASLTDPAYRLDLIVTAREAEISVQVREEVPTANLVTVTTTYTLTEIATGRVVTNGTIYTSAPYDFSSQRFANLRAERDAENRAARAAAEDIRTRIAAVFATG